jgi:ribosomal protein S18 acetylase RimI-like enzyme
MPISKATIEDIPSLLKVINAAYRGEASTKGWTTEAHLLVGELRTDEASLLELFNNKNAVVLKFINNNEAILGNVYLEKQKDKLYLGLFSVSPDAQSQGIGKQLLKAADEYAAEQNCSSIYMTVISARHELIAWYMRHGYKPTGESKPFPADERFGVPTQPLELIVLQKTLGNGRNE